ncbi:hypothetical protein ACFLYG_03875 [Chloroflexota bacterium]
MPGKSQRRKKKYSIQSKKGSSSPSRPNMLTQQQAVVPTHEPVSSPNASIPSASVPTPMAKPTSVQYPYIASELRNIGILAGIMLIILIVLALVPLPW